MNLWHTKGFKWKIILSVLVFLLGLVCSTVFSVRMHQNALEARRKTAQLNATTYANYLIEDFDRSPERFDYMVNAQDFGFNHANCIGEVGFKDSELYLCQELYVFGKDTDEIIQQAEGRFQKRLTMYCDSAEPDRIRMWRKAGYRAVPVKKEPGSVHAQIDHLKQHKLHIHPSCVNTIKEIQQWKWRRDEKSGQYLDEPVNFFDDAMAMLRYSIEQERRAKPKLNRNIKGGL